MDQYALSKCKQRLRIQVEKLSLDSKSKSLKSLGGFYVLSEKTLF